MKRNQTRLAALSRLAVPLVLAAVVTGCKGIHGEIDDVREPSLHYQRHPIEVTKGKVKLKVHAASARLSGPQEDAVVRFAQQARDHNAGRIYVRRPTYGAAADVVAGKITHILSSNGVPPKAIAHQTYSGKGPVVVSYARRFARTEKCGTFNEDFAANTSNLAYYDHGCSSQHNLAAVVANPRDFEKPRTMTGRDNGRRDKVFKDYREPRNTATPIEDSDKATVSTVKE